MIPTVKFIRAREETELLWGGEIRCFAGKLTANAL